MYGFHIAFWFQEELMVVTLASKSPKGLEQLQVMLMMCIESLQTDHVCVIILVGKKPLAGETPVFKGLNWSYGLSWHENVSIFGGFCLGWLVTSCPIHRGSEITPYFWPIHGLISRGQVSGDGNFFRSLASVRPAFPTHLLWRWSWPWILGESEWNLAGETGSLLSHLDG